MHNFPIKLGNKEFWISRSIAICVIAITRDNKILIVKRGNNGQDEPGKWCLPCGYLDYGETLKQACTREFSEETGLYKHPDNFKLYNIFDTPSENRQNVTLCYYIEECERLSYFSPNDEIVDRAYISVDEISYYTFAFNHDKVISKFMSDFYDN